MKEELQEKLKEGLGEIEAADAKIQEAEKVAQPIHKSKAMASTSMVKLADDLDTATGEATEAVAEAKKTVAGVSEGVDEELKSWLSTEVKKLEARMVRFEP